MPENINQSSRRINSVYLRCHWLILNYVLQTEEDFVDETAASEKPRPMRSMGLGYILEDPQWLENEDDQMETAAMKTAT